MANEVKLTFKVSDDGTLKLVTKKAKNAKKATDDLTRSTDNLTNSRNRYNKAEKGVGSLGANSTKNFSKMNATMGGGGGLVAAYATLAANAFALTAAFGALRKAAAFDQLVGGLTEIGSAAGQNLPYVADQLRDVTNGAISAEQALRATAVATSSGFSPDQLVKLTKVAKGASTALGRDMGDALDRLVRGTAKLEPEILDELGIIVRLDDATEKYAAGLGKTAGQLSTFERQQAFLNATIDQGSKKFGQIAENIEVNSFDQLAATFQDLAKNILSFLNKGIIPLVDFLSQNQFALAGALVLFISSIGKALVPSIKSVADANKAAAMQSAKAYRASGTVISSEFSKIQSKAIATAASTKTLPASVQKMIPAYKQGTMSVKELQTMVRALTQSEKLREVANKKRSGEDKIAKQIELNGIIALREETQKLIAAEGQRNVANAKGTRAKGKSTGSRITSKYLTQMEGTDNPFKKLSIAAKGTIVQLQNVGRTYTRTAGSIGKGTAFVSAGRVAFTAASGAVKLFGSALLSAIPFIGQAILLFSIFKEPIMGFINKLRGIDPELEKIKDSFDSFAEINSKLTKTLEHSGGAFESFIAKTKAKTGVVNQLESALQGLIDKEQERRNTEINSNIDKIIAKETQLNAIRNNMTNFKSQKSGHAGKENRRNLKRLTEEVDALRAANVELGSDVGLETKDSATGKKAVQVAKAFQDRLASTDGALAAAFSEEDKTRIGEIIQTLEGGGDIRTAMGQLDEYSGRYDRLNASLGAVGDKISEVNAASSAQVRKAQGPLGDLINSYESLGNELNNIVTLSGASAPVLEGMTDNEGLTEFSKNLKSVFSEKELKDLAKRATETINSELAEGAEPFSFSGNENADAPTLIAAALKEINTELMTVAERSKEATEIAKDIGQISKDNSAATALQISFEKKAIQIKLDGLAAEEKSAKLTLEGQELKDKIAEIEGKRLVLTEKQVKVEDETFRIGKAKLANEKKMLGFANKRTAALKAMMDLEIKMARSRLQLERAQQGSSVTAEDEVKLLTDAQAKQDKMADAQLKNKLKGIDLEFDLLGLQFALEEAKIARLLDEKKITGGEAAKLTAPITAARTAIEGTEDEEGLRGVSKAAARAETQAGKDQRQIAIDTATEKANREKITRELAEQAVAVQILRNAGRESAAISGEEAAIQSALTQLQTDRIKMEKADGFNSESEAYQQKLLEIEQKKLELITKQREQRALDLAQADRLGGSAGVALETANQSQQDSFGEGGAFNSESGASSLERVQAMREMTSGMISELAKLGPEGELAAAVASAGLNMSETFLQLGENIQNAGSSMEKGASIAAAAGQAIGQIGSIMAAASQAKIAGIDQEIAAEKKRDGKSKESLAKIAALEKKKEAAKRKAFEMNKKMQMAQTIANTASAVMQSFVNAGGFPLGMPMAVAMGAIGAAQLAVISGTSYQGGGSAGGDVSGGPSKISLGERNNTVDLANSKSARGELAYMRGADGTGGASNFRPTGAFTGMKYRANGGNTAFMVGEQGPELFMPDRPGTIVPSDEVEQAAPTNVSFNINTVDSSGVEDLLVAQRGNIIGMIRQAANSYGRDFVEEVDTSVFTQSSGGVSRY